MDAFDDVVSLNMVFDQLIGVPSTMQVGCNVLSSTSFSWQTSTWEIASIAAAMLVSWQHLHYRLVHIGTANPVHSRQYSIQAAAPGDDVGFWPYLWWPFQSFSFCGYAPYLQPVVIGTDAEKKSLNTGFQLMLRLHVLQALCWQDAGLGYPRAKLSLGWLTGELATN